MERRKKYSGLIALTKCIRPGSATMPWRPRLFPAPADRDTRTPTLGGFAALMANTLKGQEHEQ